MDVVQRPPRLSSFVGLIFFFCRFSFADNSQPKPNPCVTVFHTQFWLDVLIICLLPEKPIMHMNSLTAADIFVLMYLKI